MAEEWITSTEAAELSGYTPYHIRRLIQSGHIKAQKFGPTWQIGRRSLMAYLQKVAKAGERRGPKNKG